MLKNPPLRLEILQITMGYRMKTTPQVCFTALLPFLFLSFSSLACFNFFDLSLKWPFWFSGPSHFPIIHFTPYGFLIPTMALTVVTSAPKDRHASLSLVHQHHTIINFVLKATWKDVKVKLWKEYFHSLFSSLSSSPLLSLCKNPNMRLPAGCVACKGKLIGLKWLNNPTS